jgi:curved DNA-binding protein CbpA
MASETTTEVPERVRVLVEEMYEGLDVLPYYILLGVARDSNCDQIRDAFYHRAEVLHPDRFFNLADEALRTKIYEVYKRIAEAYRVLENPEARKEYDEGLAQGRVRYVKEEREGLNLKQPDEGIENLQAKRFFRLGLDALNAGDLKGARLNFGFALSMEPQSAVVKEQIREVDRKLGGTRKP